MKEKLKSFFKPSKRKIIIFLVFFFLIFMYLPLAKCVDSHDTKESMCTKYEICTVDVYYSMFSIIANDELCEETKLTFMGIFILPLIILIFSYSIACITDLLYTKYRDI
jgi:hypothetical protein